MKTIRFFSLLFFCITASAQAQTFLTTPIDGLQGKDYTIVNYVDWDFAGILDARCGTKTYDGHEGTDFSLFSFVQMDSGVNVLAAADGVVTYIKDGEFDRETSRDVAKQLGNYIAVRHANKYYTYYGHLKKNSIRVNVGDTVVSGQTIAQVGSSGNSTDPHLHFEVWHDSSYVVDPMSGNCGNPTSLFFNEPTYDTSLKVLEKGLSLKTGLEINQLRERTDVLACCPIEVKSSGNQDLNFWAQLQGLRAGKLMHIKWFTPNGILWFDYAYTLDKDYWYYYYWSYITHSNLAIGEWNISLEYDGKQILEQTFLVQEETGFVENLVENNRCFNRVVSPVELQELLLQENVLVYNIIGNKIDEKNNTSLLPRGVYIVLDSRKNTFCTSKIILK